MPLTLRAPRPPKSPNYEIRGTYLGVHVERSARTADKKLAVRIKKQIEREIEAGIFTPKGGMTFLEAAVAYMKAGGERTFLGPIIEYDGAYAIRDRIIATIIPEDIDHLAEALYPNNTPQSRNRQVYTPVIAVLRRAGVERRFHRPKGWEGKQSKSFLEYDEAFRLLDAADDVDREFGLLCYTLCYTGRRIGDMLNPNTKLRNLNLKNGTLYLGRTKNGEPITVHLPDHVIAKFKAMPPRPVRKSGMSQANAGVPFLLRDPDARLFRFHKGGRLRAMLAEAMKRAGLSFPKRERGFHLFCHTYATWCIRGGMDNYALARTGRWKDPRSVAKYIHNVASAEAKRAAALLPVKK
jgi:integrase